jgi:hypothetical protein
VIPVSFSQLKDPEEILYFRHMKTSMALPADQVKRLRETGGRLLREVPAFQHLLADLNLEQ